MLKAYFCIFFGIHEMTRIYFQILGKVMGMKIPSDSILRKARSVS